MGDDAVTAILERLRHAWMHAIRVQLVDVYCPVAAVQ
jgi:hypothetical protein